MCFISNLKSDLYKFFHSSLLLIHLFIPLTGVVLFVSYYSISPWNELNKLSVYIQILSVSFPFLIGITTSALAENEQKAGNFQMLLSLPTKKYTPHLSKLLILFLFGFSSSILALVGFGIGFSEIDYTIYNNVFYLKTAMLLSVSVLPLYVLQYSISFFCGKGFGLGLGIVGSLLSALLLTGLGDGLRYFNPWGIAARFSQTLLTSKAKNSEFIEYSGIAQSIIFIIISCVVLLTLLIAISNKWEGRNSED